MTLIFITLVLECFRVYAKDKIFKINLKKSDLEVIYFFLLES